MRLFRVSLCIFLVRRNVDAVPATYTGFGGLNGEVRFTVDYENDSDSNLEIQYECDGKGGYFKLHTFVEVFKTPLEGKKQDANSVFDVNKKRHTTKLYGKSRGMSVDHLRGNLRPNTASTSVDGMSTVEPYASEAGASTDSLPNAEDGQLSIYDRRPDGENDQQSDEELDTVPSFILPRSISEDEIRTKFAEACGEQFGEFDDEAQLLGAEEITDSLFFMTFLGRSVSLARGQAPLPVGDFHLEGNENVTFRSMDGANIAMKVEGEGGREIVVPLRPESNNNKNDRLINVMAKDVVVRTSSIFSETWWSFLENYGRLSNGRKPLDGQSFLKFFWNEEDGTWSTMVDGEEKRLIRLPFKLSESRGR